MKMTYTDIKQQFLRNINTVGSTDVNVLADFNTNLGQRYQLILAKLKNFKTQGQATATTVANQQYYSYPVSIVDIESATITIGTFKQPLQIVNSQHNWDVLNAIQIQASVIPQLILPRKDDFGIWPIPQAAYTITFNSHLRDRNLLVDDYSTGTITATNNSTTITGSSTVFTGGMVDRWFTITDTSAIGHGYWYRVGSYTSPTIIDLDNSFAGTGASGLTYKIGEVPEIPEEGHIVLSDGVTADYYSGVRNDPTKSIWWNNKFWTGDGNNNNREEGSGTNIGGLLGLMERYSDRNNERIIRRNPNLLPLGYKVFAQTLS